MIINKTIKLMKRLTASVVAVFLNSQLSFAAGESDFTSTYYDAIALVLLLIIFIAFLSIIYFESRTVDDEKKESLFSKFKQAVTKSTPIEKEDEILLDHDFDGIKELDNKVPPWFSWLFYITIIFSIYYMLHYHVLGTGDLQIAEYEEEMMLASQELDELNKTGAMINEDNVTALNDDASLLSGKEIYDNNCIACHAADGGGLVGPNFTDNYWIHGGGIKNIFRVVKYGVPEKGMISWQTQLSPVQMQEVSSYILTMQGTTPASPKAPEGEIWENSDSTSVIN